MEKALEKIKEIIDFCDAVGCHRAIYESIKFVEKELEEAMKPKTCEWCKWNVQVGDVGHFHCWKSRELHYCQANGFIDYCNEFEPKDNA